MILSPSLFYFVPSTILPPSKMALEGGLYRSDSVSSEEGFQRSPLEAEQEQDIVDMVVVNGDGSTQSVSRTGEDPTNSDEVTGSRSKSVLDDAVRQRRRKVLFMVALVPVIVSAALLGVFSTTERGDTATAEFNETDLGKLSSPMEGATSSPAFFIAVIVAAPSPAPSAFAKVPPSTISPSRLSELSSSRFSPPPTTAPYDLPTISPITTSTLSPSPPPSETACTPFGYCEDDMACCSGICKIDDRFGENVCKEAKEDAQNPEDDQKPGDAQKPEDDQKPGDALKPEDDCNALEGDKCDDKMMVCCEGVTCIEKVCVFTRRFTIEPPPNRLLKVEGRIGQ